MMMKAREWDEHNVRISCFCAVKRQTALDVIALQEHKEFRSFFTKKSSSRPVRSRGNTVLSVPIPTVLPFSPDKVLS